MSLAHARRAAPLRHGAHADIACATDEGSVTTRFARIDTAVASSRGSGRHVNEDCHSALGRNCALFVVADGVGGGALASHASRHLVSSVHGALERGQIDAEAIRAALFEADRKIGASIASETDAPGAATVALAVATDALLTRWLVAWVGDCRGYCLRDGDGIAQLVTLDDTYGHLREQPPDGRSLDDPARMIGNGAIDAPNIRGIELHERDMLVLCSDGLHKHADAADIGEVLRAPDSLAHRCRRLVELARARGSRDDVTVLVVRRRQRTGSVPGQREAAKP